MIVFRLVAKQVPGYKGFNLLRSLQDTDEVEFTTIMWFESLDAVRAFVGEGFSIAYVPPEAREILARFEARAQHYEVREQLSY